MAFNYNEMHCISSRNRRFLSKISDFGVKERKNREFSFSREFLSSLPKKERKTFFLYIFLSLKEICIRRSLMLIQNISSICSYKEDKVFFALVNNTLAFYSLGVNEIFDSFLIPLGPGDLLAHHAISLALHVTSLIVLKGSLDGCGSKLMPDKLHLGFGYACLMPQYLS